MKRSTSRPNTNSMHISIGKPEKREGGIRRVDKGVGQNLPDVAVRQDLRAVENKRVQQPGAAESD